MDRISKEFIPEMDVFTEDNPLSAVNLLPFAIGESVKARRKERPDLFGLSEEELKKKIGADKKKLSLVDNVLRLQFWLEYDSAILEQRRMNATRIQGGCCTRDYFYNEFISNPWKVSWMVCPPVNYAVRVSEALHFATTRMREILELDPAKVPAKDRVQLMGLQLKIYQTLDVKVAGAPVQRIAHLHASVGEAQKGVLEMAGGKMELLEQQLKELEKKEKYLKEKSMNPGGQVDVIETDGGMVSEAAPGGDSVA